MIFCYATTSYHTYINFGKNPNVSILGEENGRIPTPEFKNSVLLAFYTVNFISY
jgi:hypothetical protein